MKEVTDVNPLRFYSSARLRLGLGSVVFNLLLVWGLFLFCWRGWAFQFNITFLNVLLMVPTVFIGLILINIPWDYAAGYLLEKKAGRYNGTLNNWISQWMTGVLGYGALQIAGGYLFAIWIFRNGFSLAIIPLLPGILAGLRIWQFYLIPERFRQPGQWPGRYENSLKAELKKLKEPWPEDLYLYRSEDGSTLNGGRVGMGSHSRLMISDSSASVLSPRELAILITREERHLGWSSGQKHFHHSLGWGLLGILVAIQGIGALQLKGSSAWFWLLAALTTWHALGLVVLSGIARRQVLKADRETVRGEVTKKEYAALLKKLQIRNQTPSQVSWINEFLFQSMPSLNVRLKRLERL